MQGLLVLNVRLWSSKDGEANEYQLETAHG